MDKIKILVVDDSALMRRIISDMINSENDMEVVDTARDGEDLLKKLSLIRPDVITLDVEMPKLDGISALKEMKKHNINIPVIMLSSVSHTGTRQTMECLEAGAFDFIPKPSGSISLDIKKVKSDVVEKVRLAYESNAGKFIEVKDMPSVKEIEFQNTNNNFRKSAFKSNYVESKNIQAVVIGASTGGPRALYKVITELPEDLGVPVFVVQHMPVGFTKAFAERLDANSKLKVVEAQEGMSIEKNVVYIAQGGYHMKISSHKRIALTTESPMWGVRPAVDKLFVSAARTYRAHLLSVVLTGMGKDGAQGTVEIKKGGGTTFAEDKSTCTIYGMPKAAYETGMVDHVLPIGEVAANIVKVVMGR